MSPVRPPESAREFTRKTVAEPERGPHLLVGRAAIISDD
jgi:hypothetical protein